MSFLIIFALDFNLVDHCVVFVHVLFDYLFFIMIYQHNFLDFNNLLYLFGLNYIIYNLKLSNHFTYFEFLIHFDLYVNFYHNLDCLSYAVIDLALDFYSF